MKVVSPLPWWHRLAWTSTMSGKSGAARWSWAPRALEPWDPAIGSYQGGQPLAGSSAHYLWFSGILTLWLWAPHLGPLSFSSWDGQVNVTEMCGLRSWTVLGVVLVPSLRAFRLLVGIVAASHPHYEIHL